MFLIYIIVLVSLSYRISVSVRYR